MESQRKIVVKGLNGGQNKSFSQRKKIRGLTEECWEWEQKQRDSDRKLSGKWNCW